MNENNNTESVLYAVGTRGYSAYEVAVQNGFIGTEQEWLDSLVGPQGPQGTPFDELTPEQKEEIRGPEGKSAYEVALEEGYEGTEEDFVNSYINAYNYYNKSEINTIKNELQSDFESDLNIEKTNRETKETNLQDQIDCLANGNPSVANSVSDMTDTSKLYVNLSDGYIYYYDTLTSDWVQGWLYQAVQIDDGEVNYNKLETKLKNSFVLSTELIEEIIVLKKYINPSGTESSNNYTAYISIPVNYRDSYKVTIPYSISTFGSTEPIYMFKNNNSVVSYVKGGDVSLDNNKFNAIIDIPYGVDELVINHLYGNTINDTLKVTKVVRYNVDNISKEQLDSDLQKIFVDKYEEVTPTLFVQNALLGPNDVASINNYSIYSIDVEPGEKYKISGKQIYTNPFIAFGNANSQITYNLNGIDYVFECITSKIIGTSGEEFINYIFVIPENCNKIYLNKQSNKPITINKCVGYEVKIDKYDATSLNPLNEKTILFVGDSVTAASTAGVKGWATLISENNPTANIYNYGVDGATLSVNANNPSNNVINYLETMYNEHSEADYIIIQGGINDAWMPNTVPMGTFEKDTIFNNSPNYDKSTFCGALEYIFYYCLTHFAGKKVGFIISPQMAGIGNFREYMNKAKEICNKWSIPYVDLFNEGNLNFHVTSQRQNYSITNVTPTGDGTHPNLAGYQIITPKIENWMKYNI